MHEAEGTVIVHVQINLTLTSCMSIPGRIMLVLWLVYVDSISKGYSVMGRRPVKCALAFNYSMFCFENPRGTQIHKNEYYCANRNIVDCSVCGSHCNTSFLSML